MIYPCTEFLTNKLIEVDKHSKTLEEYIEVSSIQDLNNEEETIEMKKPKFLSGKLPLTKAEIGTTVHLVMQKLDFKQSYTLEKVKELLEELEQKEIITNEQKQAIPVQKILEFTQTKIFKELSEAKEVKSQLEHQILGWQQEFYSLRYRASWF